MKLETFKRYYAITINNLELTKELKSIDKTYNFIINVLRFYEQVEVNIISVERNEINENIHYHILLTSISDLSKESFYLQTLNIWIKEIIKINEVILYYDYVKKDGNFKVYKVPEVITTNEKYYIRALNFWKENPDLAVNDYLLKYPEHIKRFRELDRLYQVFNDKRNKERKEG